MVRGLATVTPSAVATAVCLAKMVLAALRHRAARPPTPLTPPERPQSRDFVVALAIPGAELGLGKGCQILPTPTSPGGDYHFVHI